MDYISTNKLYFNLDNYEKGKIPVTAEIILNNFCDYNCSYCRYKKGDKYIKFETFEKVIKKIKELGIKTVILTGGGEPLLHKDIEKIFKILEENKIKYGINTNFSKYIKTKAEWIKVSLHENNYTDKVLRNIEKIKKENNKTVVGIQLIIKEKKDIEKFYNKFKNVNCDYISFRPLELKEEFYKQEDVKEIKKELSKLKTKDKRIIINGKWDYIFKKYNKCYANWSVITIDYNANVWYCCHKPQEVVGSFFDENIIQKKNEYKTDIKTCEKPCRMSGTNEAFENFLNAKHKNFI